MSNMGILIGAIGAGIGFAAAHYGAPQWIALFGVSLWVIGLLLLAVAMAIRIARGIKNILH